MASEARAILVNEKCEVIKLQWVGGSLLSLCLLFYNFPKVYLLQ